MYAICPTCNRSVKVDDDKATLCDLPAHKDKQDKPCTGEGRVGFVFEYDWDNKPKGYEPPPPPLPEPQWRRPK